MTMENKEISDDDLAEQMSLWFLWLRENQIEIEELSQIDLWELYE